jgi:hypothetical protein
MAFMVVQKNIHKNLKHDLLASKNRKGTFATQILCIKRSKTKSKEFLKHMYKDRTGIHNHKSKKTLIAERQIQKQI